MKLTIPEFKTALVEKSLPAGVHLHKETVSEITSLGGGCIRFVVSTAGVDRDGDRVMQDGWSLDNYRRNPVVLWGHKSDDPPIGRCREINVIDGRLVATVEFVPSHVSSVGAFAEGIRQLCEGGFLFGTSVGFKPLEWVVTDDVERGADTLSPGVDFTACELLEFSIVSVPANPEALILPREQPLVSDVPAKTLNRAVFERRARLCRVLELESI